MSRPRYEVEKDRINEKKAMDVVLLHIKDKCAIREPKAYKMADKYCADYAVTFFEKPPANRISLIVEVKHKEYPITKYQDHILALDKWWALQRFRSTGIRTICLFPFTDGMYYIDAATFKPHEYWWGGRTDRNDPDDLEPCIVIPIKAFIPLEEFRT